MRKKKFKLKLPRKRLKMAAFSAKLKALLKGQFLIKDLSRSEKLNNRF